MFVSEYPKDVVEKGDWWLDTSDSSVDRLKHYNGDSWDIVNETEKIWVAGTTCADVLDGRAIPFYRFTEKDIDS